MAADGTNHRPPDPAGRHRYAVPRAGREETAAVLDGILRLPPLVSAERAAEVRAMTRAWTSLPRNERWARR
ncbi:hypothetical protein [Streptomyces sp. MAR4 CNX-425]|uniref:hypothetical protein n=1 Tax=Streptomyces sp. MAR4 CNX-425 TaxID=3406343 RepID=UPI003B511F82